MRNILHNETQNSLLIKRGYIQQQILSESEIQYLLNQVRKVCPESDFQPHSDASSHPYIFSSYAAVDSEYLREFGSRIVKEVLFPHVEQLFDGYRIMSCGLFIKAPKGGWIDIHYHHQINIDEEKYWLMDIWCPLTDTDVSNGTFHAVPGSHKIFPKIVHHTCSYDPFFKDYTQVIRDKYSIPLPSKAGEAVIFEDSMLHWSPNNMTDYTRYAIHCMCIPKEVTPIHVHFDPKAPQQFELYEATDKFLTETVFGKPIPRPSDLKLLAITPNNNHAYTLEEFEERMQNPDKIRRELYPDIPNISEEEFLELLEKEDEIRQKIDSPNVIHNLSAMNPEMRVSLDDTQQKVMTSGIAKVPSVLTRIAATCMDILGMKPRSTAKVLSVPQTSGVIRQAGTPINQHTVADVTNYYNEWTQSYIEGFGEVFQGSRPDSTDELLDYIIGAAQLEDGMTVLDAGCGVCGPAIAFAERRNLRIEAVTLSEVQVAEGQQRIQDRGLQNRITVRKGDFHQLAKIYPPAHFDRVLFLESLCHAEDYREVIRQAKQVLKPGGCIYIKDFYAADYRSSPHLLEVQAEDLRELNRIYCLIMPDLPSTVDLISELGFGIIYLREPQYTYSPAAWENFMRHTNVFWLPKLDNPERAVIRPIEIFAYNYH
ncbi:class I SAM-dependent methyltransferase [Dolichospermum sp. LEGE 00246]|uniref:class I SAM-dependent methyltransferase n=1 Tax=Dolichospermum sp. LEGE 00246 TaxID=1828605 RepID=UPI00188018EF|nr:class I SAM-dependent methyltransferase [Dolichospermum sp. LEGE 00246]MBE9257023.1 class I SAM-dependent methyltransferase [Dolichospermum sp. LEGE 00246]